MAPGLGCSAGTPHHRVKTVIIRRNRSLTSSDMVSVSHKKSSSFFLCEQGKRLLALSARRRRIAYFSACFSSDFFPPQANGFTNPNLTLQDPRCKATVNATHYTLATPLTGCLTTVYPMHGSPMALHINSVSTAERVCKPSARRLLRFWVRAQVAQPAMTLVRRCLTISESVTSPVVSSDHVSEGSRLWPTPPQRLSVTCPFKTG